MTSIVAEIGSYAADMLPSDPVVWCRQYSTPKIVHDALWGTFQLKAHEVALIDTPLIQRLRYIHQTGAVSLTYPSALHTRFEHTLGVMYQASRICSALQSRPNEHRFDDAVTTGARFAALVHDTGHGPFSHTSEQYFSSLPEMDELKSTDKRFRDSGAGEILSYFIITSDPFKSFVQCLNDQFKLALDCDQIAGMITGGVDNAKMYQSEIIHGPFDADKLDYMHRDGMFSGLEMRVDVDRLYNSIDVMTGGPASQRMTRLVGTMAGTSPLTQIMFNKMLLYTGMYHHHKVRAVDCMLWAVMDLAVQRKKRLGGRLLSSPVDFLRLTDDFVLVPELTDDDDIRDIINSIRSRRLWKRALVISRGTASEDMHDMGSYHGGPFGDFVILSGNRRDKILRRRELANTIWENAGRPCSQHEVWLDIPSLPSMDEAKLMWIRTHTDAEPVTLGEVLPITQWVELYGTHKWRAHVFCPENVRGEINRSALEVLDAEFHLKLTGLATEYAGMK